MRLAFILTSYLLVCFNGMAQYWPDKGQQIRIADINGKRGLVRLYYPNLIAPPVYDEITWLSKGSFFIKKNNFYGILDTLGVEKIKPDTYTHAATRTDIEPGKTLAVLFTYNAGGPGQNLLADENGNILARNFYEVTGKRDNLVIVTVSSDDSIQRELFFEKNEPDKIFKYGILKTDGSWLIKPGDREFRFVSRYCIEATERTNPYPAFKLSLLNREGKSIIEGEFLNYNYDRRINDSLRKLNQVCVQNDDTEWFVDSMGTVVSKRLRRAPELKDVVDPTTKKHGGKINDKWVIQPRYTSVYTTFFYAMAYDSANKITDIYDKHGKLLKSTHFASVRTVHYTGRNRNQLPDNELLFGQVDDDVFLLDKNYKPGSTPIQHPLQLLYSNGSASHFLFQTKKGAYGVMDQAGKVIINFSQDYYAIHETFEENKLVHIKSGRDVYNVYDLEGTLRFTNVTSVRISTLNPGICYVLKNACQTVYLLRDFKAIGPQAIYTYIEELPKYKVAIASIGAEGFILGADFLPLVNTPFSKIERDSFALVLMNSNKKQMVLGVGQTKLSEAFDAVYNPLRTRLNKLYVVKINHKYGLINYKGKTLLNCEWDTLLFVGKKMVAKSGQKNYLSDTNYVLDKNNRVDSIKTACWGTVAFYKTNNKWHLLDDYADLGIEFDEGMIECTNTDLLNIKNNGKFGVYSRVKRKWAVKPVFDSMVTFTTKYKDNRHVYFTLKNKRKYFIDTLKDSSIGPGFDFIEPMQLMAEWPNSYLTNHLVNTGGKVSRSAGTGAKSNTVTAGKFGVANSKSELLHAMNGDQAIALIDENYRYYDYDGWLYDNVPGFLWNSGGLVEEYIAFMPDSVNQIFYDALGNEHTVKLAPTPAYDKKITGGKFGIVGPDGKEVLPVIYDKIVFMYNGGDYDSKKDHRKSYSDFVYDRGPRDRLLLFPVFLKKDHKWGAADLSGKVIIPVEYDSIADAAFETEKTIQVWKNGYYGFFDLFGNVLIPTEYTNKQDYDLYSNDDTFSRFTILQKGGSMKEYYFVRKVQLSEYNEDGEEKIVMKNDTMRFNYFSGGKLGIFDPGNFKTLLAAEYDDIRFMQQVRQQASDPAGKISDLRLSITQKPGLMPAFTTSHHVPYFEIKKSGKWGIYLLNKGIIVEPHYEDVEVTYSVLDSPQYGYGSGDNDANNPGPAVGFKFKEGGKWGIMNPGGKIILKAEYDSIGFTDENFYKTLKAGKVKLFNTAGEPI